MSWSVITIIAASTSAQPATVRPEVELGGVATRILVDQIRSIDVRYVADEPTFYLAGHELAEVEQAVTRYLGL